MSQNNLEELRHSCAHLLAAAVLELYPEAKPTIGPAIENGFYYDFDFGNIKISQSELSRIEEKMKQLVKKWERFDRYQLTKEEALSEFKNNPYKIELIKELINKGEEITVYQSGQFRDLCRGGHIEKPALQLKYFKLLSVAGAYWRGDEKNKMLTRIYGSCFFTKEELNKYLWQLEEAKKRDHKKLGKALEFFIIPQEIGSGLVIWLPKGAIIRREIEKLIIKEQTKEKYQHVYSPHIGKKSLWETSGHWDLYRDKMYQPMMIDQTEYLVKPMNCPMHIMVYKNKPRSYRELPLKIAEIATVYRYEQEGELSGLARVRHITQDDAHIFCQKKQIKDEFKKVIDLALKLLEIFQIKEFEIVLSVRDLKNKNKYLGDDQTWQEAETEIKKAVAEKKIDLKIVEGEAAFYGPKLDILIKDALGRRWQCTTIQVDFMLPQRFKLNYINENGQEETPVMIHRALLGSLERFIAILIEHYAGAFPLWLSPIQVMVLPISKKTVDFAKEINQKLVDNGIRAEINLHDETISKKIRQSILQKIPYMIIIGEKELESYKVDKVYKIAVRTRNGHDLGRLNLENFIISLKEQIEKFS